MSARERPELLTRDTERHPLHIFVCAVAVVVFALMLAGIWFRGAYVAYEIVGESMQDTLFDGDWVYGRQGVRAERGDIVILDVTKRRVFSDNTIIKRLIAVEGDTVRCTGGKIYLRYAGTSEFEQLDEPYAVGSCRDFSPCELKEGQIFVLGDNRAPSHDSSEEGPLDAEEIVAVVPEWSVRNRGAVSAWENFRISVRNFFSRAFG